MDFFSLKPRNSCLKSFCSPFLNAPRLQTEKSFFIRIQKAQNCLELCFTTRSLRTKLCGIRSQTEEQEFVDPFKSWYLATLSDPENC